MIRNYTLEDGSEFKTVTIPKGTLLFHGMQLESNKPVNIFSHLIGKHSKEKGGYYISPTTNIFFYPVPYVSASVNYFNVYIAYLTNYDIELLLMIRPSEMARNNRLNDKNEIKLIRTCSEISDKDSCGFMMSNDDPCFTQYALENYPNLGGYIAIAMTDHKRFIDQYKRIYTKYDSYRKLIHILPSLVSNSRDIVSIPEIVLYPFHIRQKNCVEFKLKNIEDEPSRIVNYCIRNRRFFNYFPLLYINERGLYHITDLKNYDLYKNFGNETTIMENIYYNRHIFDKIELLMDVLLSPSGANIKGIIYKLTVDLRTGFYILNKSVHIQDIEEEGDEEQNIYDNTMLTYETWDEIREEFKNNIIPFQYPLKNKYKIMTMLGYQPDILENYELRLGNHGLNLTNKYVLDKGNSTRKYKNVFRIQEILKRVDLESSHHPKINKSRRRIKRKVHKTRHKHIIIK